MREVSLVGVSQTEVGYNSNSNSNRFVPWAWALGPCRMPDVADLIHSRLNPILPHTRHGQLYL